MASVSNKEGCSVELRSLIPELHFELNSNGITPGWSDMFRSGYIVEAKFGVPDFKLNSIPCTLYCLTTIQANMEMPLLWELYAGQNQIRKGSIELSRNSSSLLIDIPLIETDFVFVLNASGSI